MIDSKSIPRRSLWLVFGVLLLLAAFTLVGNLQEYNRINDLKTTGEHISVPVDSVATTHSGKKEIFVKLTVKGKQYHARKKVKENVARGDSVPVYYMPGNPANNIIAAE